MLGRTPHGVRGLKSGLPDRPVQDQRSHPSRGAWIEIPRHRVRTRSTWSHSSRGAWIEIYYDMARRGLNGAAGDGLQAFLDEDKED